MNYKIIRNSAKCLICGSEIESRSVHDFKWCECRSIAVDGGHDYLKRAGQISLCQETSILEYQTEVLLTSKELKLLMIGIRSEILRLTKRKKPATKEINELNYLDSLLENADKRLAQKRGLKIYE